jgi:spore coat polysaccharide biosynthesis protein SpsF
MAKVVASIEARMNSSRLPGKVLADICGKPALTRLLNRLSLCQSIDDIILATTTSGKDDVLVEWAESEGISFFRGSESDVLSRVVKANRKMNTDIIVEICGDMTLLDPHVIDNAVELFLAEECDVVTTTLTPSFPVGIDAVVFPYASLKWVDENIRDPLVREHVSLHFFNHPEKYKAINLEAPEKYHFPDYRCVLDYEEDLHFIREVYARLEPDFGDAFGLHEIIDLLKKEPSLLEINCQMP